MDIVERQKILLQGIKTEFEYLKPSQWSEKYRKMSSEVSTIKGKFKYNNTPYTRELVDALSPDHPAKVISVMKGSQAGITDGLIVNGIAWIIANEPGNIIFLSANDDLSREVVESRLDQALLSCGIKHLIRPNTLRKRNQRTGDTSKYKEFAGGRLYAGGLQSTDKFSRQRSLRYGFFDDFESAPIQDKEQGDVLSLIQKRFSTAKNVMKQFYISTPETRPSNIERTYLMGDQRVWMVPCPKCGEYITIEWKQVIFEKDESGGLVSDSVRYRCQKCEGEFKEKHKYEMNLNGQWVPTAKPQRKNYQSYYLSNLTSPPFMYGWNEFAEEWCDIYRSGNESKGKLKVFYNQTLGLPWEERQEQIRKNRLAHNTRTYPVYNVPNELSLNDGNGEILILTCACDLNGTLDDARLDYEVTGHSETGSVYCIDQGSIGTYHLPSGAYGQSWESDDDRPKWTYRNNEADNVWDYFLQNVINRDYAVDDGREMNIIITGVDTGYMTNFAYNFMDANPGRIVGLKGETDDKFRKFSKDYKKFRRAQERTNLYLLEVDLIKNNLAEMINLEWKSGKGIAQPPGFINFPEPSEGKYTVNGYFKQYEAEQKVIEQNDDGDPVGWKWKRKHSSTPNHFFDTMVYNLALRNIYADFLCREAKLKYTGWADFVNLIKNMM